MQRVMQRVTLQRVTPTQHTSPIRMRAILAELKRNIAETPTQVTDAIRPIQASPKITRPMLPLDCQNRPYVKIRDHDIDTLKLVERAVQHFYKLEQRYPFCIPLSAIRYLHIGAVMKFYWVPGTNEKIPYAYEKGNHDYDVMARG